MCFNDRGSRNRKSQTGVLPWEENRLGFGFYRELRVGTMQNLTVLVLILLSNYLFIFFYNFTKNVEKMKVF